MDWQRNFREHILDRGYNYYCKGLVENLQKEEGILTATVHGTEEYDVEITFCGEEVMDMYCSCPYAEGSNCCKHMAAVLFACENNDFDHEEEAKTGIDSAKMLVSEANEETVRDFLIMVLEKNEKLYMRFKNIIRPGISGQDMNRYICQIDRIVQKYWGRNHYINYNQVDYFIRSLEAFLYEDVRMVMDMKCYPEAFELTNYIFITIDKVDMYDSDGEIGLIASRCYEIWLEILDKADIEVKRDMYEWFTNQLDNFFIDYLQECIEQIIMEEFTEREFLQLKLDFTDKKVKESEEITDSWSMDYDIGRWVLNHLALMESCHSTWHELEKYCIKHWKPSTVRRYYIDQCVKHKDFDRAIEVLLESQKLDSEYRGLICDYSTKLKDIYKMSGKQELYLEQLWQLILRENAGDLNIYRELKKQYSEEEWKKRREKIFNALPPCAHVEKLYKEDKLYDKLLCYVQKSSGLFALQEYENVLKKDYPEQILKKYRTEVEQMAEHTSDRSHYKQVVFVLRSMQKITGGKALVNEIVLHWRKAYRNRPAMMDELSRL